MNKNKKNFKLEYNQDKTDNIEKNRSKKKEENEKEIKINNLKQKPSIRKSLKEQKREQKNIYIVIGIIIFLIILIDQLSKFVIINKEEITIITNSLVLKVNKANNELNYDTSIVINIITNIVILCIAFGIIKNNNQFVSNKTKILLSFAIGGGISNIIDKILRGGVVEFINIGNLPALNIADICIAIGWISFVAIFASFSSKEFENKKKIS